LGFVFTRNDGSATIGVVMFVTQAQSQRNYLPLLDISTNETKQQSNTLHIGTHILSKSSKDNTQNPIAIAFLLHLGFVFTRNDGSATIGVVMFVTKGLGFVIQLQGGIIRLNISIRWGIFRLYLGVGL
jgi:flavin-dependent dehydrogenase